MKRREVIENYYGARGDGEALAEVRHHIQELTRQIAQSETSIAAADSMTAKADLMTPKDRLDERLFQLQQRMQTEQMENFKAKREELRKLEALRSLDSEVELIAAAQWHQVQSPLSSGVGGRKRKTATCYTGPSFSRQSILSPWQGERDPCALTDCALYSHRAMMRFDDTSADG